jgi:carbohydrate-selective porin OprB
MPAQTDATNQAMTAGAALTSSSVLEVESPRNNRHLNSRELLENHGVVFGFSYKSEIFGSLLRDRNQEHDVVLLGSGMSTLDLDLSKLKIYRGHVSVGAQSLQGTGLNESPMDAVQLSSNLDASRYTKLMEAWYGDSYLQDRLNFKVGRLFADGDFGTIENGADFLNASYGVLPTSPMPTYPDPALGFAASGTPASWLSFGVGVYRGNILYPLEEDGAERHKGVFTLSEARFKPQTKGALQNSAFRVGAWQQSNGTWMSDAVAGDTPVRNYGVYLGGDYRFGKHSEEENKLAVFARWGWAPSDRNEISNYRTAGITYPGLNPLRQQDVVGLGVTQITLPEGERETVCELFYKLQLSKQIMIQPDVQWANNPSGTGGNTAVAGMRVEFNF